MPNLSSGSRVLTRGRDTAQRRYHSVEPHALRSDAQLGANHPALKAPRTVFALSVHDPMTSPRLLVSGHNNSKIGFRITKGAWSGMPIYTLTLEERATCPTSCHNWRECFGNSMPFSRRHRHGRGLEKRLEQELKALSLAHPCGFVVRLHVLGDFYSLGYIRRWGAWLQRMPAIRVFGYTAHPRSSAQGEMLDRLNERWPGRFAMRFSVAAPTGMPREATTIWRQPEAAWVSEGLVCPAQTGRTDCCATCALCWSPAMSDVPIVFIGHGRRKHTKL